MDLRRRPSVTSRLSFAVSNAERGEPLDQPAVAADQQIEEEIAEIKRYEVPSLAALGPNLLLNLANDAPRTSQPLVRTPRPSGRSHNPEYSRRYTDWVQDAAQERQRRKARRKRTAGLYDRGQVDWRYKLYTLYEAAQGWIVITIIGAAIGLNAAFLNIITEWLSDIKMGYCTTAFYLNENFCCWGEDNGCPQWHRWTGFEPVNYVVYIIFAVCVVQGNDHSPYADSRRPYSPLFPPLLSSAMRLTRLGRAFLKSSASSLGL